MHQLRFVDIVKQKLHLVDLEKGPSSHRAYDLEAAVGSVTIHISIKISH